MSTSMLGAPHVEQRHVLPPYDVQDFARDLVTVIATHAEVHISLVVPGCDPDLVGSTGPVLPIVFQAVVARAVTRGDARALGGAQRRQLSQHPLQTLAVTETPIVCFEPA